MRLASEVAKHKRQSQLLRFRVKERLATKISVQVVGKTREGETPQFTFTVMDDQFAGCHSCCRDAPTGRLPLLLLRFHQNQQVRIRLMSGEYEHGAVNDAGVRVVIAP